MDGGWTRRRILIWGQTRPELSQKYREIVCTGGIFEDTKTLVRLYPVPLRYLGGNGAFKKYQWIEADVQKSSSDPRPESYKIRFDNIKLLDVVKTKQGNWDERAGWIVNGNNIKDSVEVLQALQATNGTSLGLVKPKIVSHVSAQRIGQRERSIFWEKYRRALSQMELPLDPNSRKEIKPLTPPDYRFKIVFRCDDKNCKGHTFSALDWEIDALYFNLKKRGDGPESASQKVIDKIKEICSEKNDLLFFLGNISTHPQIFTIVGFWYPKKKIQEAKGQQVLPLS